MKRKMINSQISNFKTYSMYFRQMETLAENVFEFKNLPDYIDISYLNRILLRKGAIAFFYDDVLESVIALPFNTKGRYDHYGRPVAIEVYGQNGYRRSLNRDEFVIMWDNNGRYPLYLDICQMAERIALCVRTQDVNIKQQRTPRIFLVPKEQELTIKNMVEQIDSMQENIIGYDGAEIKTLEKLEAPAPFVSDKIDDHLDKLWAEFYRLIGVANLQEQKRERVIVDEMTASQGGTIASRFSRFEPRKRAVEQINKKWNINLEVQYYDGEPSTIEERSKDVRDVSNLSNNSESNENIGVE